MNLQVLINKTIVKIEGKVGDGEMIFTTDEGKKYIFFHSQDCCEQVVIEDIIGDLQDLIGKPLVEAEESSSQIDPPGYKVPKYRYSYTWTFYKFGTRKGHVTVRWLGESNGWYGEHVEMREE